MAIDMWVSHLDLQGGWGRSSEHQLGFNKLKVFRPLPGPRPPPYVGVLPGTGCARDFDARDMKRTPHAFISRRAPLRCTREPMRGVGPPPCRRGCGRG